MKLILKFWIVIFTIIYLLSCTKDNTTTPQDTETMSDYMPLTIGSWWKYEQYDVDDFGTRYNKMIYTLTVTETKIVSGKLGFVISAKSENSDSTHELYYHIEGEELFIFEEEIAEEYGGWLIFADLNNNLWTLKDTTEISDSVGIHSESYTNWTIKKGGQKDFQLNGRTIQSQEFISELIWIITDIKESVSDVDTLKFIGHTWYGKGVGMIHRINSEIFTHKDNPWPNKEEKETILIDYEIK
ncbi:MAG: hypothetical protein HZB41_04480 [Ignavibacteriae bacterium]|nr:hypothetical protein [Ignavibacteriota bacterium]